jgi:4,5-dihydroxyphthalate decarboxylase
MHHDAIRRDVYERDPSVAGKLFTALCKSKKIALARLHKGHPLMLPWAHDDIHEIDEVFGGDPYPYGIEPNRPTLEALVAYMTEQSFIKERIPLEELFVPVPKDLS